MYERTAASQQFRDKTGSFATRANADGTNSLAPDRTVFAATCKEQLATMRRNRAALAETFHDLRDSDRERVRQLLADLDRQIGSLFRTIDNNARARFEEIFLVVAQHRLPKTAFLVLVEEAREYWRGEGMANNLPPPSPGKRNKLAKRAAKKLAETGAA